jgi:hypothetical protein
LIYGVTLIANRVACEKAPPDNISKYPSAVPLPVPATESITAFNCAASRKGTGITAPKRKTMITSTVKSIFLRSSGIFQAFLIVLNN